jgi:hypothetical protein
MAKFYAKKGPRKEFVIGCTLDHVCSGSDELQGLRGLKKMWRGARDAIKHA